MYDISKIIEIRCDRCGDKTSIWYPVSAFVKIILKQTRRDGVVHREEMYLSRVQ